jgi:hypothetical protein
MDKDAHCVLNPRKENRKNNPTVAGMLRVTSPDNRLEPGLLEKLPGLCFLRDE